MQSQAMFLMLFVVCWLRWWYDFFLVLHLLTHFLCNQKGLCINGWKLCFLEKLFCHPKRGYARSPSLSPSFSFYRFTA